MKLGTITITGKYPMEVDGLFLGYTNRIKRVYHLTDRGIQRKNILYKTFDTLFLIEKLGIIEAKHSLKVKV